MAAMPVAAGFRRRPDKQQSGKSKRMPQDHIRYDILAQDALRGVIRKVLSLSLIHISEPTRRS